MTPIMIQNACPSAHPTGTDPTGIGPTSADAVSPQARDFALIDQHTWWVGGRLTPDLFDACGGTVLDHPRRRSARSTLDETRGSLIHYLPCID